MKRHALSLWFAGLATLGMLRTWAAVYRHGEFDATAMLWMTGSILMAAIAWASWRRRPRA